MTEVCFRDTLKRYLHPIIEWTDKDVWQYIRERELPYCKLYDEGFSRIGCVGCPSSDRKKQFNRWPRFKAAYLKAFQKAAHKRIHAGLTNEKITWIDGDTMFDWWMTENREKEDPDQGVLFE
jgi:phosphoadenosine phosphosulfate reductase